VKLIPWRNPEFLRHFRAELRWHRAVAVAVVVVVVCFLLWLICWSEQQAILAAARRGAQQFGGVFNEQLAKMERESVSLTLRTFYQWLLAFQIFVVTLWSLLACTQAVSGERERKTWDFQRATRLSSAELLVGKLAGEPILAYFAVACSLPLAVIAGVAGGFAIQRIAAAYVFLLADAFLLGLVGLCLSTLVETRSRGAGTIAALGLYVLALFSYTLNRGPLPGLSALSPLTGIRAVADDAYLFGMDLYPAILLGRTVPWLLLSLALQFSLALWLLLMLLRNLKRDYEQIQPLSRMQAVACAVFLNAVLYALVRPRSYLGVGSLPGSSFRSSEELASFMVGIDGLLLFLIGIAILTPPERLRVWWRTRETTGGATLSEDGLPWPWLLLCGAAVYAVMTAGLLLWRPNFPLETDTVLTAGLRLLVVLVFVMRDISFIQWCHLTRLRRPLVKGFLYLCLYYVSALVIMHVGSYVSPTFPARAATLLTPFGVFDSSDKSVATSIYAGLGFQLAGIMLQLVAVTVFIGAIHHRLGRPSTVPP